VAAAGLVFGLRPAIAPAQPVVLDDFEAVDGWTAVASEGAHVWLLAEPGRTGQALRIGFDLDAGGGFVIVRKALSMSLPENYAFRFHLRGEGLPNHFEFKLVDVTGKSVWWRRWRDFHFPAEWQEITVRKARLRFAWGPEAATAPEKVGAIEFAVAASSGGKGSLWIDDLRFEPREPAGHDGTVPLATASSAVAGSSPDHMLDGNPGTAWKSDASPEQWVQLDLGRNWECGGLVIDWDPEDFATAYEVLLSRDGVEWSQVHITSAGNGGRDYIYMPDAEARYIRLALHSSSRGRGYGIASLAVQPSSFSDSPNDFFAAVARDAREGTYPKYFYGRQTYWTVVGVDGDPKEALANEEGMVEVENGAFSVEPFLFTDGILLTWRDVHIAQSLEEGYLPIPTVTWRRDGLFLGITALAAGDPGKSILVLRYRLENQSDRRRSGHLYLALRPFQVNPPWQTLNTTGGTTHVGDIRFDGRAVWVNHTKAVVPLVAPEGFGAATFEQGPITDFLLQDRLPALREVADPLGFASAALRFAFDLLPRTHVEIPLAIPFHDPYDATAAALGPGDGLAFAAQAHDRTRAYWRGILSRVELGVPPSARKIADIARSNLAYILINRDGPAIQPGSRNYARSWIRDGASTSAALLRMGSPQPVREFLDWFAQYQFPDGKIPCCVDRRGADPVPEHDSNGAFLYAVAEYYRFTRDAGFLNDHWPRVVRAVEYIAALRAKRTTDEFRAPEKRAYYGILPESISHEGYASQPVHSYWDDFYALHGLTGAAELAEVVGDEAHAREFAALRDAFRTDLAASIAAAMEEHAIDYVPGSVELGDFDPSSTAIALFPGDEVNRLPTAALRRTFERYSEEFEKRRDGAMEWDEYSPYEVRNVGALIRFGEKRRALELLDFLLRDQRPPGWNHWAEVVWRNREAPKFLGDMPHTWVGSCFLLAVRNLFAYEDESERALVIGAGIPAEWVREPPGVAVARLPTYYGILNYRMQAAGSTVRVFLGGDIAVPPGGIVVRSPLETPVIGASVDGKPAARFDAHGATVTEFPAEVILTHSS